METVVMSVGGSMVIPAKVNSNFLKRLKRLVLEHNDKRFILIIGGGATARAYITGASETVKLSGEEKDKLGIECTLLNAYLVKTVLGDICYDQVISDPTKRIRTKKRILVAGGWKPGCSTDTDAVLLAKTYGVKHVINLTNVDYAYDKDPRKHKDAKKLVDVTWEEFISIVGDTWDPGLHAPFDPIASRHARQLDLTVSIINGKNFPNIAKCIEGKPHKGTTIRP